MGFRRGSLTRRQNLKGVGASYLALLAAVRVCARAHGFPASPVSAFRSLCSPERMRVLIVPSG